MEKVWKEAVYLQNIAAENPKSSFAIRAFYYTV
jgi:hypothetical protein